MKVSYLNIHSNNLEDLVNILNVEFNFEIKSEGNDNYVLIKEDFYNRNSGYQVNMIILNLINNIIQIDFISCGGEFTFMIWKNSELEFVEYAESLILDFCDRVNIKTEKTN